MRRFIIAAAMIVLLCGGSLRAHAGIVVTVDKTAQRLTVDVDGFTRYQWPVSTARWGYRTPNGSYRPQRLERQWFSRKYDWSPMPHSIFFAGGYAIHGSNEISRLGRPASHGCIRLHPNNAAILFDLVKRNVGNTRIEITGGGPELMARTPRREAEPPVSRPSTSFEEIFRGAPRRDRSTQTRPRQQRARAYDPPVSAGDEAAVLRGRAAWLRGLDRKYGIAR